MMNRTERFYKIDALLNASRFVPIDRMLDELQVSRATFKRDLEYMRDRLNAPVVWDRDQGGYAYECSRSQQHSLPGLWFNSSEAYALLMMQSLLSQIQPGLLGDQIAPLKARLRALIETGLHPASDVESRVRLLNVAARAVPNKNFEIIAKALLRRQRLKITYYSRGRDEASDREVSPQLLIHHRGNWYLAAWCHSQGAMRSFAMDAIREVSVLESAVRDEPRRELDAFVGQGYGIFSGASVQWARLRFSAERARWVSSELWHPGQRASVDADGRYVLELPFTDMRELVMDILRHGRHVEVLEPKELRTLILEELREALTNYT